ncbi:MAG: hypothetical protein H0V17_35565 [Deltaproteobacteria bacterium]|nr:hypothetical protein [Deltaproteobacteria bacterium]
MLKSGLAATVALTLVVVLFLWAAGKAFGFQVSVIGSLVMSIGLTLVLNLILAAFKRRDRGARGI